MADNITTDLTGKTFGRVTVLGFHHQTGEGKHARHYWECLCKCGRTRIMRTDAFVNGATCKVCRTVEIASATGPRQCIRCKQVLPRDQFHKNKRNVDGLVHMCKDCNKRHARIYIGKMKERSKEQLPPPPETKRCHSCKLVKPASEFWMDRAVKDGLARRCSECTTADAKRWYLAVGKHDPDRLAKATAYRYGITLEALKAMLASQDNRCAICLQEFTKPSSCCVDHEHESQKIRGLLCRTCNVGLGAFKDECLLLERAIGYLRERQSPRG